MNFVTEATHGAHRNVARSAQRRRRAADLRRSRRDEARAGWREAFRRVRAETERRAAHLSAEDQIVQSMADASPTKWHRAHVTWFFEQFLLVPNDPAIRFSTNAFRFCSIPITSPPARATRARSAA